MDDRLLSLYNKELAHLRQTAAEFAAEFPKVAARLGLDANECSDPYVERLLEGVAFLAARVQLKLDAEFPRFTQGLLETLCPHYLAPTPSTVIVQFQPDPSEGGLAAGFRVQRDRALRSIIGKGDQTACEYRTAHSITLFPVEVEEARYYTRDLGAILPSRIDGVKAAIRVRLRTTANVPFSQTKLGSLVFYLHGQDQTPMRIHEQLLGRCRAVLAQGIGDPTPWRFRIPSSEVSRVGFDDEHALLPVGPASFRGYRLLHEYFVLPQRFLFVELSGLAQAVQRCNARQMDLVFLLSESVTELENNVSASNFQLHCTPAVNLFPKRCDRIHLSERFSEFHVIPDRTRPLDFEVYEVGSVTGFGEDAQPAEFFRPFYSARDTDAEGAGGAFFTTHRVPRTLSQKEAQTGGRSSYAGSELYLSLVDSSAAPYDTDVKQLGIEAICTNRDLPLRMPVGTGKTDFTMEQGAPVQSIRCLSGRPTAPRPSVAEGDTAWRTISHLSLNYLSLADSSAESAPSALRDLLRLYATSGEAHVRKQIDGVVSVASRPITRRVASSGPIAFARGLEITVGFEESAYEGTGVFLLGAVLERFFAKYVSINSFTETVISSPERGEIMRWQARPGIRHIV